ncbi:hypothetical protein GH714_039566 [Hevea brasiliensis]|uniref:PB1 domain-containing protein n=1 Tax=Hevea brasiliensis TaxID=3981 RepID=A0A6A6MZS2_HEVBR|nr:hypothetical protein GH714_039566 [Hevea brasiliensis]
MRLPDLNASEVKPVHNYSITGEEFAFEFMRDRVNHKKPLIPSAAGDPNYAAGYMELKGILGISHTGSESGSDISMLPIAEKGPKEFERTSLSSHEERSNYGSVRSVPQTSSGYESRGPIHVYTSSGASDSLSGKMKVLFSFGGKILPRPSDGKLRGSDALVSVSSDEDLLNMMEEWNEVEDRQGSQKLRMFLFSISDLDDAQFGLGSAEGDSEIQYVVAVNGMEVGTRKNSTLHGLASSSGNNLDELDRLNVDRETSSAATVSVGVSTLPFTAQPILQSSSSAYETHPHPQFYHGQLMDHRETQHFLPHDHCNSSNYSPYEETPHSVPLHGLINQQGGLHEGHSGNSIQLHKSQILIKEEKRKPDVSVQQEIEPEKTRPVEKTYPVPVDEAPVGVALQGDLHSPPKKNEGRYQNLKRSLLLLML